jgi:hypothetical protein
VLAGAVAALAAAGILAEAYAGPRSARAVPLRLADTGLYSEFSSRTVDSRNLHYSPQYPLWTDGAAKSRWIQLPPGAAIDARDPDHWRFPVGTKIWKQFSWSRPVETRYMERTPRGWLFASYAWSEDGSDAVLAPESGLDTAQEVAPGATHRIPSVADCLNCHQGGRSEALGFSALQLSPDRDPLAPHAEPLADGDVTLDGLVRRRLVRRLPSEVVERPPRIAAATPRARAALGYLHANCSVCHDSKGPVASVGVSLRHALDARDAGDEPATQAIGRRTRYRAPGDPPGGGAWIVPGAPSASALVHRMTSTNPISRMPPLGTQVVDEAAVALIRGWIEEDLRPGESTDGDVNQR